MQARTLAIRWVILSPCQSNQWPELRAAAQLRPMIPQSEFFIRQDRDASGTEFLLFVEFNGAAQAGRNGGLPAFFHGAQVAKYDQIDPPGRRLRWQAERQQQQGQCGLSRDAARLIVCVHLLRGSAGEGAGSRSVASNCRSLLARVSTGSSDALMCNFFWPSSLYTLGCD